ELRTPLASIKGYATTLLADDVEWDQEAQSEFLQIISNEADRLGDLVNNLLDMSRIEAGNVDLVRFSTSAELLIQQAIDRSFPNKNGEFEVSVDPDLPLLYVDQPRIELVLRNLIENAVKYGGNQNTVHISAVKDNHKVIFTVKDNGPGIPPDEKENVFISFYRSEKHRNDNTAGVGLGLAICQGFVKAHNGEIWIDDVERGASISFSIPILREDEIETDQNIRVQRP
ncbi:MAG: ATP-binding protein, partial [Anaerolineales bacterium]